MSGCRRRSNHRRRRRLQHQALDHRDLLAVLHGVPGAAQDFHEEPVDRRHNVLRDAQEIHHGDPVALPDPAPDGAMARNVPTAGDVAKAR